MDFRFSDRVRALQDQLQKFMDQHVYPVEAEYPEHLAKAGGGPRRRSWMN